MNFWLNYERGGNIDDIPTEYYIVSIVDGSDLNSRVMRGDDCNITHANMRKIYIDRSKSIKENIKDHRMELILFANKLYREGHNQSIVFISCDEEYINYSKEFSESIEKRYGYKSYPYTTDVYRKLREKSKIQDVRQLAADMASIGRKLYREMSLKRAKDE